MSAPTPKRKPLAGEPAYDKTKTGTGVAESHSGLARHGLAPLGVGTV